VNRWKVISLCGYPQAGKDEAGVVLQKYGYIKRSFGEYVRQEVALLFTSSVFKLSMWPHMPIEAKLAFIVCAQEGDTDPWKKPTSKAMRVLLQQFGTEVRRKQFGDDYWVSLERDDLAKSFHPLVERKFYYTDIRFPNEFAFQRAIGGYLFMINNPRVPKQDHESEWYWPSFITDGIIDNTAGLLEFHDNVERAVKYWGLI
jgi:hypothetical protein